MNKTRFLVLTALIFLALVMSPASRAVAGSLDSNGCQSSFGDHRV